MENVKEGAILENSSAPFTYEVLGICGRIIFVHESREGKYGPPEFYHADDLVAYGWKVKS